MLEGLSLPDMVGAFLGFTFTVLVFTYIIGDNPFFRFTVYMFIGVAAGYTAVVVFYNVILYQLVLPLVEAKGLAFSLLVPLILGIWLVVTKASPQLTRWGNPVMAYLVGAGAAIAIGGAVLGTIFPQVAATTNLFDLEAARGSGANLLGWIVKGIIILGGTVTTLVYFHFGVRPVADQAPRRLPWIEAMASVGQIFIIITLGAIFAGVYAAALTALIERMQYAVNLLLPLIPFR